jgi:hypothetical protein
MSAGSRPQRITFTTYSIIPKEICSGAHCLLSHITNPSTNSLAWLVSIIFYCTKATAQSNVSQGSSLVPLIRFWVVERASKEFSTNQRLKSERGPCLTLLWAATIVYKDGVKKERHYPDVGLVAIASRFFSV